MSTIRRLADLGIDNSYGSAMTVEEHHVLVQKLLDDFGKDPRELSHFHFELTPDSESSLLHLHALFGSSLVSALQLVDDRDGEFADCPGITDCKLCEYDCPAGE